MTADRRPGRVSGRSTFVGMVALLFAAGCGPQRPESGPVTLSAVDGVEVFADWHRSARSERTGTILVFNQGGGDVRGEYVRIIPRLTAMGYDVLATDMRRGGDRFGMTNRTVAAAGDAEFSYCDAYHDAVAAHAEALRYDGRAILWGSSFSGALVIQLAAQDPEHVRAVLAFSPATGDPMDGCMPEPHADGLGVPLLVLRAVHEAEFPSVRAQLAAMRDMGHITHIADPGVHGSSTLDSTRVGASTEHNWSVVEAFLDGVSELGPTR